MFTSFKRSWKLSAGSKAASNVSSWNHRLAQTVQNDGLVSQELIDRAFDLSHKTGRSLSETLLDLGAISDEQMYAVFADLTGHPVWNGRGEISDDSPFSKEFLIANHVLPLKADDGKRRYVIASPEDDGMFDLLMRFDPDCAQVLLYPEAEIQFRLEGHFEIEQTDQGNTETSDVEHLKDLALEAPIIRMVNELLTNGVKMGASDIHLEPFRNRIELRYRVDGVLHNRPAPPVDDFPGVISRLKILAQLDIAERRLPQDGRIKFRSGGKDVDIRVSTVPTAFGEDVALRLLDQKKQVLDLDQLGFSPIFVNKFRDALDHSHGLVLVTGPTGSGKSTCLYAGLRNIVDGKIKIITVEDPVEYEIPGLSQIQVNAEIGVSFANALRSILRHDPDVIFIGEIRDKETAEMAVQSALTGHLVLSTIHTNSAVGAVGRLLNMGVPDYLLSSSLLAITGQRLLRQLCLHCRIERPASESERVRLHLAEHANIYEAAGCPECGEIGYRGRLPINEILTLDAELKELILSEPTTDALLGLAVQKGFVTMEQDGIAKACAGQTTIAEVMRVAR
jgi:general secretion pathway protein E